MNGVHGSQNTLVQQPILPINGTREPVRTPRWEAPSFSGESSEDFENFLVELNVYHIAMDWPEHVKSSQLCMMLKDRAKHYYLSLSTSIQNDFNRTIQAFKEKFGIQNQPDTEYYKLLHGSQGPNQSVSDYVYEMENNFRKANLTDNKIQIAIFMSGLNKKIKARFVEHAPNTLEEAWKNCTKMRTIHKTYTRCL